MIQSTKEAAESAVRTRDSEIASLRFIAEQAHSQMSSSELDMHRELREMGEDNRVLRSELAFSHSTHGDIYTVRQELNASGDLMNEMLSEFKTQLQD